jgi:hypothetical protein
VRADRGVGLTQRVRGPLVAAVAMLAVLSGAQSAWAQAPYWKVSSRSAPLYLPLEEEQLVASNDKNIKGEGRIIAVVTNLSDTSTDGSTITVTDKLPTALKPVAVNATSGEGVPGNTSREVPLACIEPFTENKVVCTFNEPIPSYEHIELRITVKSTLTAEPKSENEDPVNVVTVTGGGALEEGKAEQKLKFGADEEVAGKKVSRTHFGVEAYEFMPETEQGKPDEEAGSHPFQLTTTFYLNQTYGFSKESSQTNIQQAPGLQKNLSFRIPAGVLGNPDAVPQCSDFDFGVLEPTGGRNACADNTAIGVATVTFNEPSAGLGLKTWTLPVFNLVPSPGEPAKFGFEVTGVPIVLDTSLRTGEDYGVTVSVRETSQAVQVLGARVTLWGTPGDPKHDQTRGWNCLESGRYVAGVPSHPKCGTNEFSNPTPFLILPTDCKKLESPVSGEAWSGEKFAVRNEPPLAEKSPVALTGCQALPFEPKLSVTPDTTAGSSPSGMTVAVSLPQAETTMKAGALGEADIRETTLVLPPEVTASAGAANGLLPCGVEETGLLNAAGSGPAGNGDTGEPLANELAAQRFTADKWACPAQRIGEVIEEPSKIGEVVINTPLLPHPVSGGLYLAMQNTNPFRPLLVLYLLATEEEPIHEEWSKIVVKLAGDVKICQAVGEDNGICKEVGQLVSTFKNTPQAPVERLSIHLFGGARAAQATPAHCGPHTSEATFVPWSGGPSVASKSTFEIKSACTPQGAGLPFAPGFEAGVTKTQAGAFSPFELTLNHPDGNQALSGLRMTLPQGAAAMISSVTPCPVAVADVGGCSHASWLGRATTSSGLGGSPITLGGEAFLTETLGPGKPFGVSIKTDATHVGVPYGPFNIGTIIANSSIEVNPDTAAATIATTETRVIESSGAGTTVWPSAGHPGTLPTEVDGVPVQLKTVHVVVEREGFEFNPTNCSGRSVTGLPIAISDTITGAEGGSASQVTPYAVTGCGSLNFTPKLTASVTGQGSKANGTTFKVVVEAARGQTNIAKTFLQLPTVLPSRLSTIQQACVAAKFEILPKGSQCGEGSNIGNAVARTPVLKKPLEGKAYLVSHGNASFPDVEFVLQSEGIVIILDGKTDIKNGITYSRFETIPDAPVERFETVLPAGPHSALTANVPESEHFNLCKHASQLAMPTEITGQNGDVIKQTTKIALSGRCVLGFKTESKLAKALKACRKKYAHNKKKRISCERAAKKKYGPKPKKKSKKKH